MTEIACVEPDSLRPSKSYDLEARMRVKRDADAPLEWFAGYCQAHRSSPRGRSRDGCPRVGEVRPAGEWLCDGSPAQADLLPEPRAPPSAPCRCDPRDADERQPRDPLLIPLDSGYRCALFRRHEHPSSGITENLVDKAVALGIAERRCAP